MPDKYLSKSKIGKHKPILHVTTLLLCLMFTMHKTPNVANINEVPQLGLGFDQSLPTKTDCFYNPYQLQGRTSSTLCKVDSQKR